jgi:hypothetical protein
MKNAALRTTFSLTLAGAFAPPAEAQEVLPRPEQPFCDRIGLTAQESIKDFPKEVTAPKGAPSILIILTDDVRVTSYLEVLYTNRNFSQPN